MRLLLTSNPKARQYSFVFIIGLGLLWIFASRTLPGSPNGEIMAQPFEGFLAPDFELLTPEGELVRLSDLRGDPIIVNFWASWCPPCRAEMPAIQSVFQTYQAQGLVVLAVNAANQDDLTTAQEFIASLDLTFQVLLDMDGTAQKQYHVTALPTTFFIDRSGVIQSVIIGGPMAEALLDINARQILMEEP